MGAGRFRAQNERPVGFLLASLLERGARMAAGCHPMAALMAAPRGPLPLDQPPRARLLGDPAMAKPQSGSRCRGTRAGPFA